MNSKKATSSVNTFPAGHESVKKMKGILADILKSTESAKLMGNTERLYDYKKEMKKKPSWNSLVDNTAKDLANSFKHVWKQTKWIDVLNELGSRRDNSSLDDREYSSTPVLYMKSVMIGATNNSLKLCKIIVNDAENIRNLLKELSINYVIINHNSDPMNTSVIRTMAILHNVLRNTNCRQLYRNENAVKVFNRYVKSPNSEFQMMAVFILGNLSTETESQKLNSTPENTKMILRLIRKAALEPDHVVTQNDFVCYYGIQELTEGLNCMLINDNIKKHFMKMGALDILVAMLDPLNYTEEEQVPAVSALWKLALLEENQSPMKVHSTCVPGLQRLRTCSNDKKLSSLCKGALFALNGPEKVHAAKNKMQDVMISYQWNCQPLMIKLRTELQKAGISVWMDVGNMAEDILESMASAVETSSVILMAVSREYQESSNCRTEAKYAYREKKKIIPLIVEDNFEASSWLGAILGMTLYFRATTENDLEKVMPKIVKRIKEGISGAELANDVQQVTGERSIKKTDDGQTRSQAPVVLNKQPPLASTNNKSSTNSKSTVKKHEPIEKATNLTNSVAKNQGGHGDLSYMNSWSKNDVSSWLKEKKLVSFLVYFSDFDGAQFLELIKMNKTSPKMVEDSIKTESKCSLIELLKLKTALNEL